MSRRSVRAVVVGIESYVSESLPNISGPAMDACRFAAWLLSTGVSASQIDLLVAPLPENAESCRRITPHLKFLDPIAENVRQILYRELARSTSELLTIYWGGHGIMDEDQHRVLFFSDASDDYEDNLDISGYLSDLTTDQYDGHRKQQVVVDACAEFTDLFQQSRTLPRFRGPRGQQQPDFSQRVLLSTARGQQARNFPQGGYGVFSRALQAELDLQHTSCEIDFDTTTKNALHRMRKQLDGEFDLQTPIQLECYSGPERLWNEWIVPTQTAKMMQRIRAIDPFAGNRAAQLVALDESGSISKFLIKSERAFKDAGSVPGSNSAMDENAFAKGLYVTRNLEGILLRDILSGRQEPILVSGSPGVGKTSLLWGLGSQLALSAGMTVIFVRAPWLLSHRSQGAPLRPEIVLSAAASFVAKGQRVVTLIDTADTVVADDEGFASLLFLVDHISALGAQVVVTSRPEEARALPTTWSTPLHDGSQAVLGDFSQEPGENNAPSEYETAVASYAAAYATDAGDGIDTLVHQLANVVARRHSMAALCLRPLFLQLLFQLYSPNAVPENLSVTGLYDRYWHDRVERDQREYSYQPSSVPVRDLSEVAEFLGLEMLRLGSPEVRVSSIRPQPSNGSEDFLRGVEALVARGVGDVASGTFRFFHQTFFEYSAARALLKRAGHRSIDILLRQAKIRGTDFFLLAVLEQTWLCAWHRVDHRIAAVEIAKTLLRDDGATEDVVSVEFDALLQTAMNVIAQAPVVPDELLNSYLDKVASGPHDVVIPSLRLLPTPARRISAMETRAVSSGMGRRDKTRTQSIALFKRIADIAPGRAVALLDKIPITPEELQGLISANHPETEVHHRSLERELIPMIAELLPHEPFIVLSALDRIVQHARATGRRAIAVDVLTQLRSHHGSFGQAIALWADESTVGWPNDTQLFRATAELHRLPIAFSASAGELDSVLCEFEKALERTEHPGELSLSDSRVIAGTLLAAHELVELGCGSRLVGILLARTNPALHGLLHGGYLVPILNTGDIEVLQNIAQALADGLPAPREHHQTKEARWADTIRRAIERPDTTLEAAERVASMAVSLLAAAASPSVSEVWLSPDYLLSTVVKASAAGVASASQSLADLASGKATIPDAFSRFFSMRTREPEGSEEEVDTIVELLVSLNDHQGIHQLLDSSSANGQMTISWITDSLSRRSARLYEGILASLNSTKDVKKRKLAARLWGQSVSRGILPQPELHVLSECLNSFSEDAPPALLDILDRGFTDDLYGPHETMSILECIQQSSTTTTSPNAELRVRAKILSLKVTATCTAVADWPALIDAAFAQPVSVRGLASASSFAIADHRKGLVPDVTTRVSFLESFALRVEAEGTSRGASKDVANAWTHAIRETMALAGPPQHARLLSSLTVMNASFATQIADKLNLGNNMALHDAALAALENQRLDPAVRNKLAENMRASTRARGSSMWLDIDTDLDGDA